MNMVAWPKVEPFMDSWWLGPWYLVPRRKETLCLLSLGVHGVHGGPARGSSWIRVSLACLYKPVTFIFEGSMSSNDAGAMGLRTKVVKPMGAVGKSPCVFFL